MVTKIISPMTACSHSHLLHPFCPRQNSTEKVTNFVLYAFGAAVACWALYQMSRVGASPSRRGPVEPRSTPLVATRPLSSALNTKISDSSSSKNGVISTQEEVKAAPKPNEIADHFCNIIKAARQKPGKPIAYDWTQKDLLVSDSTPRLTVVFMQLEIEAGTEKQEVALITNSALPGKCIRWSTQAESNIRKEHYPAGMELKTLLEVLNARPRVFLE